MTSALLRLEKQGFVVNVEGEGRYRAFADPSLLGIAEKPEPCFHAFQIEVPSLLVQGGLPLPRGARQVRLGDGGQWTADPSNGQAFLRHPMSGGRGLTIQASGSGNVNVFVTATSHPIRFAEWDTFAGELRGFCAAYGIDFDAPGVQIVNIELNADFDTWFLSGAKRLKLATLGGTAAQVYNKWLEGRQVMRIEQRLTPRGLTFREAGANLKFLAQGQAPWYGTPAPELPPERDPGVA